MKKLFLLLAAWAVPAFAQFSISQLPPATTPLNGTEFFPCTQAGATKKCLTGSVTAATNAAFILQSANAGLPLSRTLVGTANEILLADGGPLGNLVLSTPQPIATASSPTFSGLTLTSLTGILVGNNASALTVYAGTSCTNQFVRALGSTGVATCNTVANTDLANSSITLNGAAIALGGTRTLSLASADFVNQGTTTTLLHGNAAGNPAFGAVANADMVNSSVTLNGASLALGGTRTLSLASADFVNQGTTTTVLHGNAAGNPSFGSVTSSDLAAGVFANPSGLIGLTAVNGVATTATRTDATHALDQSISPTWTGAHLFDGALTAGTGTTGISIGNNSTIPTVKFIASGGAVDQKNTQCYYNTSGTVFNCTFLNDANSTEKIFLQAIRGTATAVSSVTLGNPIDRPTITLTGATTATSPAIATPAFTSNCSSGTFSATANPCMSLANSSASAQTPIDFFTSTSTLTGRLRNDSAGNMSYVSFLSGSHTFSTGGDSGVGTQRMTIGPGTTVTMPTLAQSSAAQTGTMCWSAANITVDTTVACLTSTIRVKRAIEALNVGLLEVMRLHPVSYELKPEFNPFHVPGRQVGLIAEEVQKVDPRLIALDGEGQPRGVRYMQLTAVLVKSIQQQQLEIYALWAALAGSFAFTYFRTRRRG